MRCLIWFGFVWVSLSPLASQAASVFVVFDIDGRSSQIEQETLTSLSDCLAASLAIHSGEEVVLRDQVRSVLSNPDAPVPNPQQATGADQTDQKNDADADKKDASKDSAQQPATQPSSQSKPGARASSTCFDYPCQVKVAKRLQGDSVVATTIHKLGSYCYITASVSDLKRPVAKHMAKLKIGCSAGELVEAMEGVAQQIASGIKGVPLKAQPPVAPALKIAPKSKQKTKKRSRRKKR